MLVSPPPLLLRRCRGVGRVGVRTDAAAPPAIPGKPAIPGITQRSAACSWLWRRCAVREARAKGDVAENGEEADNGDAENGEEEEEEEVEGVPFVTDPSAVLAAVLWVLLVLFRRVLLRPALVSTSHQRLVGADMTKTLDTQRRHPPSTHGMIHSTTNTNSLATAHMFEDEDEDEDEVVEEVRAEEDPMAGHPRPRRRSRPHRCQAWQAAMYSNGRLGRTHVTMM